MPANSNFDAILSTSLAAYRKTIADNIFNKMPFFYWLKAKNRVKMLNGGAKIVVPLMYEKNTTVKSYSGYDPLDTTPQEGISAAEYTWKQLAGSITISRKEERQNSGETQIINLLDTKIKQAEMSLMDSFSTMLYADGTGNGSKDLLGLAALIKDTPTTGTLGGISRATYSWWRNQYTTGTKSSTAFDNLLSKMRTMYNLVQKGAGTSVPEIILSDRETFEGYESLLVSNERFTDNKVGDAGFENLKFKNCTMMWDSYCPGDPTTSATANGRMYFINSEYMQLTIDTATNFITTPFVRPKDQDAKTSQILFMGEVCANNIRNLGVITAIN